MSYVGAVLAAGALLSGGALAQTYPVKPVRLIVPFAPGGGADFMGRLVAPQLTAALGQSVIVENRPGAGGTIGYEAAIKAAPDGHILTLVSTSYSVNPSLYKLAFDPVRDIQPVIHLSRGPYVVAVHPSLPVQNIKQLIALAKAQPNTLNYASSGQGGNVHLVTELFLYRSGIRMVHIPYKGTGPALIDTLTGQASLIFGSTSSTLPYVRAGRLRGIAITSLQRSPAAPEIPSVSESGLPGFDAFDWQGIVGPRGLPKAIVDRLNNELNKTLRSRELVDRLQAAGVGPAGGTPEEFGVLISKEIELWRTVVAQAGVKLE
jgi:tripartite-type tricarboxylate transporter receptor subunit TctC